MLLLVNEENEFGGILKFLRLLRKINDRSCHTVTM